ncbi:hypothetical protein Scep_011950 [Stephania cephalantha]|uniref:Uncharacterized protein n=1 Tax=Stephania cephalantha TaxID=152367 RepID=A0AAP0JGC6_9MAGN
MPPGNTSEITSERLTLFAHILAREDMDFSKVISHSLMSFLQGPPMTVLYHPWIIILLCNRASAPFESNNYRLKLGTITDVTLKLSGSPPGYIYSDDEQLEQQP